MQVVRGWKEAAAKTVASVAARVGKAERAAKVAVAARVGVLVHIRLLAGTLGGSAGFQVHIGVVETPGSFLRTCISNRYVLSRERFRW